VAKNICCSCQIRLVRYDFGFREQLFSILSILGHGYSFETRISYFQIQFMPVWLWPA
jgi:hypothetical protein